MALRRLWHRQDGNGHFVEMVSASDDSGIGYKLYMYQGEAQDISTFVAQEIPVTDEIEKKVEEQFKGPDDPRLPGDVQKMPVGRREDFVEEFNFWYWCYDKDCDPEYNENERIGVNSIRFALNKAYAYAQRERPAPAGDPSKEKNNSVEPESGIPESSLATQESIITASGKMAHRIRENVVGVVIPGSYKESETEGDADVDVVIIRKGWSLNGRHYGDSALEGIAAQINESKPGFMNHGPTFNRDPRDWAIMLHSAESKDDEIHAKMHIFQHPDGDFLKERVEKAPHLFGGSIDAFVIQEEGKAEGRDGMIVTEVVLLNCWDIVMFPAAGGAIIGANESQAAPILTLQTGDAETMDLATLKEKHPALYELVVQQAKAEAAAEIRNLQEKADTAEAKNRELEAELDSIKSAEEKRQKQTKFEKDLNALLGEIFENDEVSEDFKALLIEEGSENMPRIKKMVAERRKMLDSVSTDVVENVDKKAPDTKTVPDDEDELSRFRSKKKVA